jgi:Fe-S-cluster containining protein
MKKAFKVNIFGAMSLCEEYFPTKAYTYAVNRLGQLLSKERDRLDSIARDLGRTYAIGPDNLAEQVPLVLQFVRDYHKAYSLYLNAVLPQHKRGIQCGPSCGNCCHHYPMSVEPFELIYLYSNLRTRDDFMSVMEDCQIRATLFESLLEKRLNEVSSEDEAEDRALHDYFSQWRPCPFSSSKGDCGIYPLRPVSCRMYFSETHPKFCVPEYLQTEQNESFVVYMPDHIEEALYGISEHYEGLSLPESYFGGLLSMNLYEGVLT